MASGGHRSKQTSRGYRRSVSPQVSTFEEDILAFINQSPADQESYFLECSDPGVLEAISLRGRDRSISPSQQSLALVPASSMGRSAASLSRTPSFNVRGGSESRWGGGYTPAAAIAVPITPRRPQQGIRYGGQSGCAAYRGTAGGHVAVCAAPDSARDPMPSPSSRSIRRNQSQRGLSSDVTTNIASNAACSAIRAANAAAKSAAVAAEIASEASRPPTRPSMAIPTESPLQLFDRVLRAELDRIRTVEQHELGVVLDADADADRASPDNSEFPGIREAAVNFARAQAACDFDAAVRAADAAASKAPPEQVEEAALSGAREYRTEIVDEFHDVVPGDRLIEVVGYVAITRPDGYIDG